MRIKDTNITNINTEQEVTVFISQPMRGKTEDEIKSARNEAINVINGLFYNATILDSYFPDYSYSEYDSLNKDLWYLSKSLEVLAKANYAVFLPGYENARGCSLEKECCDKYGINTILLKE